METEKTGIVVAGIVWAHNIFINDKGKEYHSVDLLVKSCKNMVNVKLSENYDRSQLKEGLLIRMNCAFHTGKYGSSLVAI